MEIKPIPFPAFQALTPDNEGLRVYGPSERSTPGRYLDAKTEQFFSTVSHLARAGRDVKEPRKGCDSLDDAEAAIFQALMELTGHPVTAKHAPARASSGN